MKKLIGLTGAALATAALMATPTTGASAAPGGATATTLTGTTTPGVTAAAAAATGTWSLNERFARERAVRGSQDTSVHNIAHVRELQYRLRWVGLYTSSVTGYFGAATEIAVKRYQRREGLPVTGAATRGTWAQLIRDTVRRRGAIPPVCRERGWHACYDRYTHQVTLLVNGTIWNSWLVRGGSYGSQTRLGTHPVYYRDIDHRSGLYDDAPMPYSQFFDGGQALHGSGLMMDPFAGHSHGCVNFYIEDARQLWNLTSTRRLVVTVYGAWD